MKSGIREIIGKTISKVVAMEGTAGVRSRVYLFFEDGTYYELYCGLCEIEGASGIREGGIASLNKLLDNPHTVYEAGAE